jgi:predicted dehydrogenase
MNDPSPLSIGMIGSGNITRFIHIPGFQRCPGVQVTVACDASAETAEATARAFGVPATTTDYREVLRDPDVDAVVIATPNHLHRPIAVEALEVGKHVLCEKPLGLNAAEGQEMVQVARRSGRVHMVSFVYRFVPAMRYLKYLVDSGAFGEIRHFRALYLQRVPDVWLGWRSQKRQAGSGALGDIGSHLIDFARYLVGEISAVSGWAKTFLPRRCIAGTDEYKDCDVDDAAGFLAEFANGATGVFEVSRLVLGRGIERNDFQYVEVNGTKGSAVYSLYEPFQLQVCPGAPFDEERLITVPVPRAFLKWPDSPRDVRADEPKVGFRYDQAFAFVQAIRGVRPIRLADFHDGLAAQAVVDAVLEAVDTRRWAAVKGYYSQ